MWPNPEPGLVIRYSYLWLNEAVEGREEGIKDRPCAIITAVKQEGEHRPRVLVLPVTHTEPNNPDLAIEIPASVKKHLGLDDDQSWVILSESNDFLWPGPDLRRVSDGDNSTVVYGFLPPKLFNNIRQRFLSLEDRRRPTRVIRTE